MQGARGAGRSNNINGSAVTYSRGGGASSGNGAANTGNGGAVSGGVGGSGIVALRYVTPE